MKGESETPIAHHLFDTSDDATKLFRTDAGLLHHFLEQLLYLSKLARSDIQLEISFLCTRLIDPDIDNYKKLERFINYIQGKFGLPLILSIDKSVNIKWYVNAAFVVHKYIRSHTDSFMNMGTNGVYVQFSKKKLNTKSSTEENIFGSEMS